MTRYALDRSGIVAALRREKGSEKVVPHLCGAMVSTVTIAELLSQIAARGADVTLTLEALMRLQLEIVPFTHEHAKIAATIGNENANLNFTLSDLAALSIASESNATILSANEELAKTKFGAKVRLIRKVG